MLCYRQSGSLHCKLRVLPGLRENVELWYHNGSCVWPKCIHRGDSPPSLLTRVSYLMRKVFELQEFEAFYTTKQNFFVWKVKACAVIVRLWYQSFFLIRRPQNLNEQQSKHFTWLLKASINFF